MMWKLNTEWTYSEVGDISPAAKLVKLKLFAYSYILEVLMREQENI